MAKQDVFNDAACIENTTFAIPQQTEYYVYALLDPQNNEIFYIGKGKNGRIMDHIAEAKRAISSITEPNAKVQRIIDILNKQKECPKFVILRSGLTEETAYQVEGVMIDFLNCKDYNFNGVADLQNIQSGHHDDTNGIQTLDDLRRLINAKEYIIKENEKILAISINQSFFLRHRNVDQAVRSSWHINLQRAKRAQYIVAIFQGVIVGVYENAVWSPVKASFPTRYEFTATKVTTQSVQKRMYYHKWPLKFGSGNPIRYTYR